MKKSLIVCLAAAILCLSGCGGGGYAGTPVKGKVTIAGKGPLPGGLIQFVSLANPDAISGGQIRPDGSFDVSDAPLGECKVVIDNSHLNPSKGSAAVKGPGMGMRKGPAGAASKMGAAPKGSADLAPPSSGGNPADSKYARIDESYQSASTTPLRHTVKPGDSIDFEVK